MKSPRYITVSQTRSALHALYRSDPEVGAAQTLQRAFEDELVPKNAQGRWRPSGLVVIMGGIFLSAIGVFIYFSIR